MMRKVRRSRRVNQSEQSPQITIALIKVAMVLPLLTVFFAIMIYILRIIAPLN